MKATLPIAQVEGNAVPNANQPPPKRDRAAADEFGTALAEQMLEREPKSKAPVREKPEQRSEQDYDTPHSEAAGKADESFMRSDGRLRHRLREMSNPPLKEVPDDARRTAPPKSDVPDPSAMPTLKVVPEADVIASVSAQLLGTAQPGDTNTAIIHGALNFTALFPVGDNTESRRDGAFPVQAGEETHVNAMTTPPFDRLTSSSSVYPERPKAFKAHAPGASGREIDYRGQSSGVGRDAAAGEIISGTPVTVRDQQTHFSRGPVDRKIAPAQPAAPALREPTAHRSGPAEVSLRGNEPRQLGLVEKSGDAGLLPLETTDARTPAAQLLSKLLEACDEGGAPSEAPAPSSAWLSTDRPFGAMMRLIRLELSPGSLGVVHVTLRGVNSALSISIEAEQPQTAASLGADQSTLSSRLRDAGYAIDELVVTTFDRSLDVAGPARSDQTSGASNSALAGGTDDLQRRNADDGWRRQRSDADEAKQGETHGSERDASRGGAEGAPSTAWRGRHVTRSV